MPIHEEKRANAACAVAETLQHLGPGPLAECRRMTAPDGTPTFWRLAARHPETIGHTARIREWMTLIRIFAILTPKGDPSERHDLHDPKRRFGTVLCDGGDPTWPHLEYGQPSPIISEQRLAKLVTAREPQRGVLLERTARHLARTRPPNNGINVIDIASTLLNPNDWKRIVKPYYDRLDRAEQATKKSEEGAS